MDLIPSSWISAQFKHRRGQVAQTHCYVWRRYRSQQPSSGPQESSLCLRHTLMLRMKCAALVASLFLRVLSCPGATGESGSCQGKTVDVYLDSSFISGGDYFPDTYVKVGYTVNTLCLRGPFIINTSQFTFSIFTDECWRSVVNKQSCQKWDLRSLQTVVYIHGYQEQHVEDWSLGWKQKFKWRWCEASGGMSDSPEGICQRRDVHVWQGSGVAYLRLYVTGESWISPLLEDVFRVFLLWDFLIIMSRDPVVVT